MKWMLKNVSSEGSKWKNKICEVDGIIFHSKYEAKYYSYLKALKDAGEVSFFLRQAPFHLPGGIKYIVDFIVFYSNGEVDFVDVKGAITPMYSMKKKQVESLYPIQITEVRK